jgi:hypothetical protein
MSQLTSLLDSCLAWLGLMYGEKFPFAVANTRVQFMQSDEFLNYKLNHRPMDSELRPIIGVKPT